MQHKEIAKLLPILQPVLLHNLVVDLLRPVLYALDDNCADLREYIWSVFVLLGRGCQHVEVVHVIWRILKLQITQNLLYFVTIRTQLTQLVFKPLLFCLGEE